MRTTHTIEKIEDKSTLNVCVVSTYPPRECGIATYTKAVIRPLDQLFLQQKASIVAVSDKQFSYSDEVVFNIHQNKRTDYKRAANFLNTSECQVVNLQHEYGIYGGDYGEYILDFLDALQKPVVTTLHTVLTEHTKKRKKITQAIIDRSDAIIVMTIDSKRTLTSVFDVDPHSVHVISHGVPNIRPDEQAKEKSSLGLSNRFVLSTFGLLNPGKGIEFVLDALPEIMNTCPEVLYLIAGKTHPVVKQKQGEQYREMLEKKVQQLQLQSHVQFINNYLDYSHIVGLLKATDVYIAPQLDPHQASSGTIAYAIGAGCAIISTPTVYSEQMLANGRGYFVDFSNSAAIAKKVRFLINHPDVLEQKRKQTYLYGRKMIWPAVSLHHLTIFEQLAYGCSRNTL